MNPDSGKNEQSQGINLGDIYFVLFRQKWMIILFSAVGVIGAIAAFVIRPPRYNSDAKLYIRYVMEAKALTPPGDDAPARSLQPGEASILNTEVQILKSRDVAEEVAAAVGPEKILAKEGGGTNTNQATRLILGYLDVEVQPNGSVISVSFQHPDPEVAKEVLHEVIVAYIKKHKEMHQSVGIFGDFLNQETERLRSNLSQTEKELMAAKGKVGVTSLDDAKKACTEQISNIRENLIAAQAELAEYQPMPAEVTRLAPASPESTNAESQPPLELVNEYKGLCARLDLFSKKEQDLLTQFTKESLPVQQILQQIEQAKTRKMKLEEAYPVLASLIISMPKPAGQPAEMLTDYSAETSQEKALKAKIEFLNSRLAQVQAEATRISEMEPKILELQQKKDLEESDLKYFSANLERARIEDALGSGKAPNIGILQSPSAPIKGWSKPFKKKVAMVAIGPALCGLGLAFLIEFFLDRSVKRPIEFETKLRLPLFISIPDFSRKRSRLLAVATGRDRLRLREADSKDSSEEAGMLEVASAERSHPLRRFYEGLRDRLAVHFEVWNLKHKPKLVAVTSCRKGAGVTSIATGLAASLSETGDGNVLLVDMNCEQGAAQHFYKGKLSCGLDDALADETMQGAMVQTNLYVAAERSNNNKLPRVLPSRFATLVPKFKASHYDYIIFDMPPVSQTSVTPRLAGFMDMVLLVIESEKTSQDVVKRANALLAESKANVSAVLNKTHTYVPDRLQQELPNDV